MMTLDTILSRLGQNAPDPEDRWEPGEWLAPGAPRRAELAEDFRQRAAELGCAGSETESISAEESAGALGSAEWVYVDPFGARVWWDFLPDAEREIERGSK